MAIALAKKLADIPVGNILLIGSSGTGKTTLMRAVERFLAAEPALRERSTVVRLHANVLGEEAERGSPGAAVLRRLLERAREQMGRAAPVEELLQRAARGLVFVDEVDKIRSHIGDRPNVAGIRAQEALLTLIENERVPFERPSGRRRHPCWSTPAPAVRVAPAPSEFCTTASTTASPSAATARAAADHPRRESGQGTRGTVFRPARLAAQRGSLRLRSAAQFLSASTRWCCWGTSTRTPCAGFLETPDSGLPQARAYSRAAASTWRCRPAGRRRIAAEAARHRAWARGAQEVFRR